MNIKVYISFGPSKSHNFRRAVKLAREFSVFTEGERCNLDLQPEEIFKRWEPFNQLFHMVRGWASFILIVDDEMLSKSDYSDFFYGLQDIYLCQKQKTLSEQPDFCQQFDWGCSQVKSMRLHPLGYDGGHFWYHYGHFKGRTWIVHKKEIESVLRAEIKRKHLDACPFFDFKRIQSEIDMLPDEIDLRENKFFEVVHRMKFVGGNIMEVPDSIRHRSDLVFRVNGV